MEGHQIKSLIEAYSKVYEIPEVLNEEVEVEEVDMELEEDSEVLDEQGQRGSGMRNAPSDRFQQQLSGVGSFFRGLGSQGTMQGGRSRFNRRNRSSSSTPTPPPFKGPGGDPSGSGRGQAQQRPPTPSPSPSPSAAPASTASKPAAAAPAKPVVKQTGDKAKDMATWAKANPTLANKPKTPNPLMKDMPGATLKKAQEAPKPQMSKRAQNLAAGGPKGGPRENVDLFDVIKGHLLDEGYAETEENALVIMTNMSEEWRNDIIEGYQRNPEKGEKEDKKYEKVRGEKTPMPPRGDKRREDFEKWYAKQMGR